MATEHPLPAQGLPLYSVALLSAAALAYEVLLTRLFAIVQWSHFAAVAISLALLGFAAGGTLISVFRAWLEVRFARAFSGACILFALAVPGSFALAQGMPFNPLELAWDPWQFAWLSGQFVVLSLPFLAAGTAIGMALGFRQRGLAAIYAADLLGAGLGAVSIVLLLAVADEASVLRGVAALGLLAGTVAAIELRTGRGWCLATVLAAALGLLGLLAANGLVQPRLSPYKDLAQALQVTGSTRVAERGAIDGRYTVLGNASVPVRHAPGISLGFVGRLPEQLALYHNGDALGGVTRFDGDPAALGFTAAMVSALPYALAPRARVLLLEPGGGLPVLQALYHGARRIHVVEPLAGRATLLRGELAAFSGGLLDRDGVTVLTGLPRQALDAWRVAADGPLDLVMADLTQGGSLVAPGLAARDADWLQTVEGLGRAFDLLAPDGVLAVSHWLHRPPRESLRLFATAHAMLAVRRASGAPAGHLLYLRGWKTGVLLVSRGAFTRSDRERVARFAREHSFDRVFPGGTDCAAANRFNRLPEPAFCRGMQALAGRHAQDFIAAYLFDIRPLHDDRPFAANFTRLSRLAELFDLEAGAGYAQIDWGHALLIATLLQAIPVSLLLVLLPLWFARRRPRGPRAPTLLYFSAIGVGFMALEISYIESLQRFIGEPVLAVSLVLGGFLVFAAAGSVSSTRLVARRGRGSLLHATIALLAVLLAQAVLQGPLFAAAAQLSTAWRLVLALLWLAPPAFLLGIPFPLGMRDLAGRADLVPWAWAINGCASVIGAVLAALLLMDAGFMATLALAVACYLVATLVHLQAGRRVP